MEYDYEDDDYDDSEPDVSIPIDIPKLRTFSGNEQSTHRDKVQIVEGLLKAGDIACIYGHPGVGKSVLAPYLGYCVALGKPFFRRATKAGKVLYIAAEDAEGIYWRINVLGNPIDSLSITGEIYDLFEPYKVDFSCYTDIHKLLNYIIDESVSLIIIDTLSRSFPGLDENNHKSMSQLLDNVELIASVRDCAVVLVHHDSKADTGKPRGHGSFWARLDTAIYLQRRQSGVVNCSVEKNKTRQSGETFKFAIHVAEAGYDSGLSLITAPVLVEMADGPNESTKESSKAELAALRILDELQQAGPVSEREWLAACAAGNRVSGAGQPTDRLRVARRVIQNLKGYGLIATGDGFVSRVSQ
jgi:AAA domain